MTVMTERSNPLGLTLFERLQFDASGEVLRKQARHFEAERRALERAWQNTPHDDAAARAALTSLEQALKAAENVMQAAADSLGRSWAQALLDATDNAIEADDEPGMAKFLMDSALLAIEMKFNGSALSILDTLIQIDPSQPLARLMRAQLFCRVSKEHEGRHQLLQLIEEFPDLHMASAMLAVEDRKTNTPGWQGLAESVVANGDDPASEEVARVALGT
jgi:predicted Zn-dependent protease